MAKSVCGVGRGGLVGVACVVALALASAATGACGDTATTPGDAGQAGPLEAGARDATNLPLDGAGVDAAVVDGALPADSAPPPDAAPGDGAAEGGLDGAADGGSDAAADAADPPDAADAATPPMSLTSPTLTDGGRFPAAHTCTGVNRSPALTWTAGPAGTGSYAIVMKDLTVPNIHWTLYDIPASVLTVGAGVPNGYLPAAPAPAGSKHAGVTFSPATLGYLGPCPPSGDHDYVFTVHAVSGATLAGAAMSDTPEVLEAKILAQRVPTGSATLSAKYMKP